MNCWYCGSQLIWQNDFNYDEVFGEGEGVVTYLKCLNDDCGSEIQISKSSKRE